MATSGPGPEHGRPPPEPEPADAGRLPARERAELEEMRNRLAVLEASSRPVRRRHLLRSWASALLILIASVLSLLSVLAVWTDSIVGDTDRYVATVAPLAGNPDVQQAITQRVTGLVLDQVDVQALVNQLSQAAAAKNLPPATSKLITSLNGPITKGLTELVSGTVRRVVSSDAFATVWVEANRAAHTALDKALTGKGGGAVSLENDQVTIDVGPIVSRVKGELVNSGLTVAGKIPAVRTDFVVFTSKDVSKVKTYFRVLEILGNWLPVVTVLIAAAGVFLAADRRRALLVAALGVAAAMLLLGVGLTVFRGVYLDHLPPGTSSAAAGAVFDALVRFLRASVRAVGALAIATALGAFLVGPSRVAVAVRNGFRNGIGALRGVAESSGLRLGATGRFVHRYKRWIGGVILTVAAIVLFTWSYPTAVVVGWTAVVVLAALAIREFLDTGPQDGAERPSEPTRNGAKSV